jgi:hypothetical protein
MPFIKPYRLQDERRFGFRPFGPGIIVSHRACALLPFSGVYRSNTDRFDVAIFHCMPE